MRISIGYSGSTPLPETFPAADAAEAKGLDGIWSAEHVGLNDAIVPATAYACRTSRLELGIMGLNADTRSPGVLAMEIATLNSIAPGRVRLHVGTGSPQRGARIGATGTRTVRGVEAFVSALRALLRGDAVTASSEAFALDGLTIAADPSLPLVAIDVMAIRPRMTALAARIADGLSLSVGASHDYLRSQVALSERVLEETGRDRADFRVSAVVLACVDDDYEAALGKLAAIAATFPVSSVPEMHAGLELPDGGMLKQTIAEEGAAAAGQLFARETVEGLGLVATPATLSAAIDRYRADGIDELIVMSSSAPASHPALIGLLAKAR